MNSLHPVNSEGKALLINMPAAKIRTLTTHPMTGSRRMRDMTQFPTVRNRLEPLDWFVISDGFP